MLGVHRITQHDIDCRFCSYAKIISRTSWSGRPTLNAIHPGYLEDSHDSPEDRRSQIHMLRPQVEYNKLSVPAR